MNLTMTVVSHNMLSENVSNKDKQPNLLNPHAQETYYGLQAHGLKSVPNHFFLKKKNIYILLIYHEIFSITIKSSN